MIPIVLTLLYYHGNTQVARPGRNESQIFGQWFFHVCVVASKAGSQLIITEIIPA